MKKNLTLLKSSTSIRSRARTIGSAEWSGRPDGDHDADADDDDDYHDDDDNVVDYHDDDNDESLAWEDFFDPLTGDQ